MRIERADLAAMGASAAALKFYDGAEPIEITKNGSIYSLEIFGDPAVTYDSASALLADIEAMAQEIEEEEEEEEATTTYREYFIKNDDENLAWCKPYEDETGNYKLVMHDGEPLGIMTPDREAFRYDGSLTDDLMESFARAVNPDYDYYKGYSNVHIALDAMHEIGCASCPWFDDCEPMGENMSETDCW